MYTITNTIMSTTMQSQNGYQQIPLNLINIHTVDMSGASGTSIKSYVEYV